MNIYISASISAVALSACSTPLQSPEGLWHGIVQADPGTSTQVTIAINDGEPVSTNGEASIIDGKVTISLESGAVFKGTISNTDATIIGHFIQPGHAFGGQNVAHALRLDVQPDGTWAGLSQPLASEFSMFMDVRKSDDDSLSAVMLNPQRNITGPARKYTLEAEPNGQFQMIVPGQTTPFTYFTLNENKDRMTVDFGPLQGFKLNAIKGNAVVAKQYYGDRDHTRLNPPSTEGAWPVATPDSVGFDNEKLLDLIQELASESGASEKPNLVHSLLIARNGKLVVEEYFRGYDKDTPHDTRSAGKTFASVLVGALRQDGHDLSIDTPIDQFIPMAGQVETRAVTIGDLLTHRSGLDCYDGDNASAGNENTMWQQEAYDNFWPFIAGLSQVAEPGTHYAYCSGGMNLVGAALSGASGQSVLSLLETKLFEPLGFENAYWNTMPDDEAYLGGGAQLRTRDLMKIGQLYLSKGRWNGQQLIDPEWVEQSIKPHTDITPATTGLSEAAFQRFYFGGQDGLAWHIHTITVDGVDYASYEASGNGGQIVVVVPKLDLVVALTGGNYGQGYIWGKWRQKLVGDRIIPAIRALP